MGGGQGEEPGDGLAIVFHLGPVAVGVEGLVGLEVEHTGADGDSVVVAFEMQAVDLARQPFSVEDGFERLLAQQFDISGGPFEQAVKSGVLQASCHEVGGGGVRLSEGRDFAGRKPFDLLEEGMDARAEVAGGGAFGAEEASGRRAGPAMGIRRGLRDQLRLGGSRGQGRKIERCRARWRGEIAFGRCETPLPPARRALLKYRLLRMGGGVRSQRVLDYGFQIEGAGFGDRFRGEQVQGAFGAGHGDVEEAQFRQGSALAIPGRLCGQDRIGFQHGFHGGRQDPIHGGHGFIARRLVDHQRRLAAALGGDADVSFQRRKQDDVVLQSLGFVHGQDFDAGTRAGRGQPERFRKRGEPEGGAAGLAVEIRRQGNPFAEPFLLIGGIRRKRQGGGEVGEPAGIALFADPAAMLRQIGRGQGHLRMQGRHFDMPAGQRVAGVLDQPRQGNDRGQQHVVQQGGVSGQIGTDSDPVEREMEFEGLLVRPRENADGGVREIGNFLLQAPDPFDGDLQRAGTFFFLLKGVSPVI